MMKGERLFKESKFAEYNGVSEKEFYGIVTAKAKPKRNVEGDSSKVKSYLLTHNCQHRYQAEKVFNRQAKSMNGTLDYVSVL